MLNLLKKLWNDDYGFVISTEFMLVFATVISGIVAGLTGLRNAVNAELTETARSITSINQSFTISGIQGCGGSVGSSGVTDTPGEIQSPDFRANVKPINIDVIIPNISLSQ